MKIIDSILTNNPCYTAGRKITVKGLMLHSVGCPQPSASVFVKLWNKTTYNAACVHAFIDGNTGDVYQTLPWNHRGWHCGASGNSTHIGVEMCEPSTIKYVNGFTITNLDPVKSKAVVMRTYNAAVKLFAMLCKQYNLDPMKNIVSHNEGCKLGIASNHGDPEHLWKLYGLTMDSFRNAVKAKMNADSVLVSPTAEKASTAQSGASGTASITVPVLKQGSKGNSVVSLQQLLNAKGYSCGEADGDFGSKTLNAVKKYQAAKKLDADGSVGKLTWTALLS